MKLKYLIIIVLAVVVRVIDGDTLLAKQDGKYIRVRLYGIDAPEKKQAGGKGATQALSKLVNNKEIKIVSFGKDKYERTIAKIYCGRKYINLEMVKSGHAWWYKKYAPKAKDLEEAEKEARSKKLGVWKNKAIQPEKWRRLKNDYSVSIMQSRI